MFTGKNLLINGGTFNQTVARTGSFDKLTEKASPLAFHLADSDLSHSTCLTNTRTKILERIKGWALREIKKDKFVMWLHGPAGGGKTAIGRSIAKWCEEEEILLGEFFFSRANGTEGQLPSLAPTLAYRMAVHTLQDAKEAILDVINHDPHIFLAPLAIQLKKLVIEPFNLLASSNIRVVPYVIILDGLDETLSSQEQQLVLNVISETLYQLNSTLRILICCRPEPTIVTAFNDTDSLLYSISTFISLNDDVNADADIRAFLVKKFAKTKRLLPHPPNGDWPTAENIDYLVKKSSGQFIFAATVEKYVCSREHRHQAIARLKHVLDLRLLSHLKDKKKHPFADLDALYYLILRTRNDVKMSIDATAVCLEYPKYFTSVSPAALSRVLNIELSETWGILYELASLFETSEDSIRPFHASFGDFLFDSSRSADLFRNERDIAADITCAMLREGRDPEVLSYQEFSRLLREATPRQDLRDILNQMDPLSIFRRPASTREYDQRSKGAYYLIPFLRQLENHVSSDAFKNLVTYFDHQFELFLPIGHWGSKIFFEVIIDQKNINRRNMIEYRSSSCPDSIYSMPALYSVSDTLEDDPEYDSQDSEQVRSREKYGASRLLTYRVSELIPLSTSPAWDEINASPSIRLTGSDSLTGFCNEARFARSHLKKTMSALLKGATQAKAALFCLKQIQSKDITKDLQIAFAKLLPHSLSHAEQLPELRTAIKQLQTQQHLIYQSLPVETQKAITDYLPSTSGSSTAARTVPNVSFTRPRPSDTTKSSTQATSQKSCTTPNSSTARRTDQYLSPTTTHHMVDQQLPTSTCPRPSDTIKKSSTQVTSQNSSTTQKSSTAHRTDQSLSPTTAHHIVHQQQLSTSTHPRPSDTITKSSTQATSQNSSTTNSSTTSNSSTSHRTDQSLSPTTTHRMVDQQQLPTFTRPRPSDTITKSSIQATSQNFSTTLNSSTARRTDQSLPSTTTHHKVHQQQLPTFTRPCHSDTTTKSPTQAMSQNSSTTPNSLTAHRTDQPLYPTATHRIVHQQELPTSTRPHPSDTITKSATQATSQKSSTTPNSSTASSCRTYQSLSPTTTHNMVHQQLPTSTRSRPSDTIMKSSTQATSQNSSSTSNSSTARRTDQSLSPTATHHIIHQQQLPTSTRPRPSNAITKSSAQAMSQNPSTTPNSSTARRTDQSLYPTATHHIVHQQELPASNHPHPSDTITKSSTQVTSQKSSTTLNSSTACRMDQSLSPNTTHNMVHQQQLPTRPRPSDTITKSSTQATSQNSSTTSNSSAHRTNQSLSPTTTHHMVNHQQLPTSTRPRPSDTITKSSAQAMSQNPSTTPNSSTARRTDQSLYPTATHHIVHQQELPTSNHPRPSDTITKSSTQATSQKSSTTPNSSTARRTDQSLSPTTTHHTVDQQRLPTFTHPHSSDTIVKSSTQGTSQNFSATPNSSTARRTDQSLSPTTTHHIVHQQQLPTSTRPHPLDTVTKSSTQSTSQSSSTTLNSSTARRMDQSLSPTVTHPRPSDTTTKSSTQATSQNSSTTLNSSTARRTNQSLSPTSTHDMVHQQQLPTNSPTKQIIKDLWNPFKFGFFRKYKNDTTASVQTHDSVDHPVFGKPLKVSLRYTSVQISVANVSGDLYVWGCIPAVVAKCGLYLKENATEVPGTFRVNGSSRRMQDLQAEFERPPDYGKSLDWKQESYATHDVAIVLRRYLTQMPEPVIPRVMYHLFRDTLAKKPFNQEEVITTYKSFIRRLPKANQYLLLYVLDLLSAFAGKSDKNLMTASNLAVIFQPGLISHPQLEHENSPQEQALSQSVLKFLIEKRDWFMLDIAPNVDAEAGSSVQRGPPTNPHPQTQAQAHVQAPLPRHAYDWISPMQGVGSGLMALGSKGKGVPRGEKGTKLTIVDESELLTVSMSSDTAQNPPISTTVSVTRSQTLHKKGSGGGDGRREKSAEKRVLKKQSQVSGGMGWIPTINPTPTAIATNTTTIVMTQKSAEKSAEKKVLKKRRQVSGSIGWIPSVTLTPIATATNTTTIVVTLTSR